MSAPFYGAPPPSPVLVNIAPPGTVNLLLPTDSRICRSFFCCSDGKPYYPDVVVSVYILITISFFENFIYFAPPPHFNLEVNFLVQYIYRPKNKYYVMIRFYSKFD